MKFTENDFCSKKILNLLDYFNGEGKKDKADKKYETAINLEKMIAIYNSDLNDIRKLREMHRLYRNANAFKNNFSLLQYYSDDEQLSYYANITIEIWNYFRELEEKGLREIGKELFKMEDEGFFEDFSQASFYVKEYIKYDESPYMKDFLSHVIGISSNDFSRYVNIIKELDPSLYDEYTEKAAENANSRKYDVYNKINNIAVGVKKGILPSGEPFDEIEFLRLLPFYDKDTSKEIAEDFDIKSAPTPDQKLRKIIDIIDPTSTKDITNYMISKNLFISNQPVITEKDIMAINFMNGDDVLTDREKENILAYMEDTKIPPLMKAFNILKNRHFEERKALKLKLHE